MQAPLGASGGACVAIKRVLLSWIMTPRLLAGVIVADLKKVSFVLTLFMTPRVPARVTWR